MRFSGLVLILLLASGCTAPASAQKDRPAEAAKAAGDGPATVPHAVQFVLHSQVLRRDLAIYVAEPSGLDPSQKAAALYSLDGDSSFGLVANLARRLQGAGEMVPTYVIAIGYGAGPNLRDHDYLHNQLADVPGSGGGAPFERFLLTELKPLIERRYPVDSARSVLAGHSFGGLFVANVLVRQPQAFSGWLISSPSLWAGDEAALPKAKAMAASGRGKGGAVFLSVGEQEGQVMGDPIDRFAAALRAQGSGIAVSQKVWEGETHASVAPIAYARGLRILLAGPHYGPPDASNP